MTNYTYSFIQPKGGKKAKPVSKTPFSKADEVIYKLLQYDSPDRIRGGHPYGHAYYCKCRDGFFNDYQVILCNTQADAEHVAKALKKYAKQYPGSYTYVTTGKVENMKIPRGKIAVIVDSKAMWWRS